MSTYDRKRGMLFGLPARSFAFLRLEAKDSQPPGSQPSLRAAMTSFLWGRKYPPTFSLSAASAQFGKLFDEPGQRVPVGGIVANGDVNLNANPWCEAGQGASFSIQRCSPTGGGIRWLTPQLLQASSAARPEERPDTYLSFLFSAPIIVRSAASYQASRHLLVLAF